jgi:hypothetical protein
MGSHSAKGRRESGGVWTVICPGKQHFANPLDLSRPARGLLHTEAVDGQAMCSEQPALDASLDPGSCMAARTAMRNPSHPVGRDSDSPDARP